MDPIHLVDSPAAGSGPDDVAESESLTLLVARSLRHAIFEGRLAPGTRIPQETVARELGVSRIPVREALRQLESEGLVVHRPNSGARVAVLDFDECVEIYKLRERIEPLAIAESAGRMDDVQLRAVEQLSHSLETQPRNPDTWLAGDREFHLSCYAGVQSDRLLAMIQNLWNTTQRYRRLLLQTFTSEDYDVQIAEHH